MLLDPFMTQRMLARRGRPQRAPMHRLNGTAKVTLGLVLAGEIACVIGVGTGHSKTLVVFSAIGLVVTHVASYLIESRPGSLKPRYRRPPEPASEAAV